LCFLSTTFTDEDMSLTASEGKAPAAMSLFSSCSNDVVSGGGGTQASVPLSEIVFVHTNKPCFFPFFSFPHVPAIHAITI